MEVLLLFSFSFTALACSFAALLMPSLRQWFPFQEVHTRIPMLPLGIDGLIIGWALIMEYAIGISRWPYLGVIILLDYWTVAESTCRNGFKWIT
jgi:ABC-type Fe3+ transport system permease subunit